MKSGMMTMVRKAASWLSGLAAIMLVAAGCGGHGIGSNWTYEGENFVRVFGQDQDDEGTVYWLDQGQNRVKVMQVLDDGCLAEVSSSDRVVYVETSGNPYLDDQSLRSGYYIRRGRFTYENTLGGRRTVARYVEVTEKSSLKKIQNLIAEREAAEAKARAEREAAVAKALAGQMVDIPGAYFKLCKYEVTQALWEALMGTNPSVFKGADRPVENVSWNDCQAFIEKLNALPEVEKSGLTYRLPTEEEWEYACRAGSTGDYCKLADGTEITERTLDRVAWYGANSGYGTHPVGQKEPNAFGLYDMHGNVWEWTATADGEDRMHRGGSWNFNADYCSADSRFWYVPDVRYYSLGFRLATED